MAAIPTLIAIGTTVGPGIASSLIGKAREKDVEELWRSREKNLEKKIERAFQNYGA